MTLVNRACLCSCACDLYVALVFACAFTRACSSVGGDYGDSEM